MIQFLRGTQSQLNSSSQILSSGQPVFESDTGQLKIGNGSSRISELPYVGSIFSSSSSWQSATFTNGENGSCIYTDLDDNTRLTIGTKRVQSRGLDLSYICNDSSNDFYFRGSMNTAESVTYGDPSKLSTVLYGMATCNFSNSRAEVWVSNCYTMANNLWARFCIAYKDFTIPDENFVIPLTYLVVSSNA